MSAVAYLVHVAVVRDSIPLLPRQLAAGMPATLFIGTQPRTALEYQLQPWTDAVRRSVTEP